MSDLAEMVKRYGDNPTLEERMQWAIEHPNAPVPVAFNGDSGVRLWVASEEYLSKVSDLKEEVKDYETSFDLQWKCTQRAIRMWQLAHPDEGLVWPDKANLMVWLMERQDALQSLLQDIVDETAHLNAYPADIEKRIVEALEENDASGS